MKISPEMRAAIDGAVAEGRVERIPAGQASESVEFKSRGFGAHSGPPAHKIEAKEARQVKVREMVEQGKTAAEMAQTLGVSTATINTDKKALGLVGGKAKPVREAPIRNPEPALEPSSVIIGMVSLKELERIREKCQRAIDKAKAALDAVEAEIRRRDG